MHTATEENIKRTAEGSAFDALISTPRFLTNASLILVHGCDQEQVEWSNSLS